MVSYRKVSEFKRPAKRPFTVLGYIFLLWIQFLGAGAVNYASSFRTLTRNDAEHGDIGTIFLTADGAVLDTDGKTKAEGVSSLTYNGDDHVALKSEGTAVYLKNGAVVTGIAKVYATGFNFAGLKGDGSVVPLFSSSIDPGTAINLVDVEDIYVNLFTFTAVNKDRAVVGAWGDSQYLPTATLQKELIGIKYIQGSYSASAALTYSGKVFTWGNPSYGGDINGFRHEGCSNEGVSSIVGNMRNFAALYSDGEVCAWGVNAHIPTSANLELKAVVKLFSGSGIDDFIRGSFTALREDRTLVSWHFKSGLGDATKMFDVQDVFNMRSAWALLRQDGTVYVWGSGDGSSMDTDTQEKLTSVRTIFPIISNQGGFCAVKKPDGSLICWGGTATYLAKPMEATQVTYVVTNYYLKRSGTVVRFDGVTIAESVRILYSSTQSFSDSTALDLYPCPLGYYGQGWPDCQQCPSLSTGNGGAGEAVNFTLGIRSSVGSCLMCPSGQFSTDGLTCGDSCAEGYSYIAPNFWGRVTSNVCVRCNNPGQYYNIADRECIACDAGKFSEYGNGTSCTLCAKNYYSSAGQQRCTKCVNGFLTKEGGIHDGPTSCYSPCPPGEYGLVHDANALMSKNIKKCYPCESGKYSGQGNWTCDSCPEGHYNDLAQQSSCTACPKGKFQEAIGATVCSLCPVDSFTNSTGRAECNQCAKDHGTNHTRGNSECMNRGLYEDCQSGLHKSESGACMPCERGYFSSDGSSCLPCTAGKFSDDVGASLCTPCGIGRYSDEAASSNESACKPCPQKTYSSFVGASKCQPCPPGSECSSTALSSGTECALGRYSPIKGSNSCTICPAGQYQFNEGSASCDLCPPGTFGSESGGRSIAICKPCLSGTFSAYAGATECVMCSRTQYASETNSTTCSECGPRQIANEGRTMCVADPDYSMLAQESLVLAIYTKGIGLYGTFIVTACFVAIIALTQFKKRGGGAGVDEEMGQLELAPALIKAALAAFSFASELFLVIGLIIEGPAYAAVLISFRLLHFLVSTLYVTLIFGTSGLGATLVNWGWMSKPDELSTNVEDKFARESTIYVGAIVLLSMCDCSLLVFLPWKKSVVFTESKGWPLISMLRCCLGTKVIQSIASVACQSAFLIYGRNASDAVQTPQAKALFGMNIAFGVLSILMSIVMLTLKNGLLSRMTPSTAREEAEHAVELESQHELKHATYTDNPMLTAGANTNTVDARRVSSLAEGADEGRLHGQDEVVDTIRGENARLNEENDHLRGKVEQQGLEIARLELKLETNEGARGDDDAKALITPPLQTTVPQQGASASYSAPPPPPPRQQSSEDGTDRNIRRLSGFASVASKCNSLERPLSRLKKP